MTFLNQLKYCEMIYQAKWLSNDISYTIIINTAIIYGHEYNAGSAHTC